MRKIAFDARGLEHPKPLEEAVALLQKMDEKSYLYMRHRKNPLPLLQLAQEHGFTSLSHEHAPGEWHILITKADSVDLKELLDV